MWRESPSGVHILHGIHQFIKVPSLSPERGRQRVSHDCGYCKQTTHRKGVAVRTGEASSHASGSSALPVIACRMFTCQSSHACGCYQCGSLHKNKVFKQEALYNNSSPCDGEWPRSHKLSQGSVFKETVELT